MKSVEDVYKAQVSSSETKEEGISIKILYHFAVPKTRLPFSLDCLIDTKTGEERETEKIWADSLESVPQAVPQI